MTEKKHNPLAAKPRMPFAPTIRPTFAGGQGGMSSILYALVAVALGGYAVYQMQVQRLDLNNWRVLVALGGALYFVVRAGFMIAVQRGARDESDDKSEDKRDESGAGSS